MISLKNTLLEKIYLDYISQIENITMRLTVTNSYSQAGAVSQFTPNLHDHSFSEVFVCIKGTVNINLTNNIITLNENDAVIIPPWLYHVKQTTSSNTIDRVLSFSIIIVLRKTNLVKFFYRYDYKNNLFEHHR